MEKLIDFAEYSFKFLLGSFEKNILMLIKKRKIPNRDFKLLLENNFASLPPINPPIIQKIAIFNVFLMEMKSFL